MPSLGRVGRRPFRLPQSTLQPFVLMRIWFERFSVLCHRERGQNQCARGGDVSRLVSARRLQSRGAAPSDDENDESWEELADGVPDVDDGVEKAVRRSELIVFREVRDERRSGCVRDGFAGAVDDRQRDECGEGVRKGDCGDRDGANDVSKDDLPRASVTRTGQTRSFTRR